MPSETLELAPVANVAQLQPITEAKPTSGDFRLLKPRQRLVLNKLTVCLEVQQACREAAVANSTFYGWLDNPNFRACYDQAMQAAVPQVEVAHFKAATGKDTLARIHILKSRHPSYKEGEGSGRNATGQGAPNLTQVNLTVNAPNQLNSSPAPDLPEIAKMTALLLKSGAG